MTTSPSDRLTGAFCSRVAFYLGEVGEGEKNFLDQSNLCQNSKGKKVGRRFIRVSTREPFDQKKHPSVELWL